MRIGHIYRRTSLELCQTWLGFDAIVARQDGIRKCGHTPDVLYCI